MPNHLQPRSGSDVPPNVHLSGVQPANHRSQRQHILDVLLAANGGDVPLADIMLCAAQYNACIHELRKQGYKILNRRQTQNGVLHSWYRLESSPPELVPAPSRRKSARSQSVDTPSPSKTQPPSQIQTQSKPLPPSSIAPQTLSLFPDMAAPVEEQQKKRPVWRDPEMNAVKHG